MSVKFSRKEILMIMGATLGLVLISAIVGFNPIDIAPNPVPKNDPVAAALSPHNATYRIEGTDVTLVNGVSEVPAAPNSASKVITRYFGNEVTHDFDGDGRQDVAFLLTQAGGGSGTFFYVVAALNKETGYVGSDGLLLGDRIAPQTTEMSRNLTQKNVIVVNYAVRAPGESFDVRPSVGKSIWLLLNPATMQFGEVVQDFEGEADISKMSLGMKKWVWLHTLYNDGREVRPAKADTFTLEFTSANTFSAKTDCNGIGGEYSVNGNKIVFERMMSTLMYCEGSQESEFSRMLIETQTYSFTSRGELIFDLKFDSGSVIFR